MKKKRSRKGARLGQHFLSGTWAAHKLAAAVPTTSNETILEIGPGTGILTRALLASGTRVVAIEKDEQLVAQLRKTFAGEIASGALTLVEADIRDIAPERLGLSAGEYVVAANIPYYITGEIIRQFLSTDAQPRAMALLVQKEVAERIVARDNKQSILSISVKAYGHPKIVAKVSRGNFSPPPSVDSAILLIENISKDFFASVDERLFFSVVRAGFAHKRKVLVSNLVTKFGAKAREVCARCEISATARAEDVSLETLKMLAQRLSE
jgi:16S rRNA (adenine1518-N6/adenine1519-N6)-dimethyltransferase